jgi:hypothetical protein
MVGQRVAHLFTRVCRYLDDVRDGRFHFAKDVGLCGVAFFQHVTNPYQCRPREVLHDDDKKQENEEWDVLKVRHGISPNLTVGRKMKKATIRGRGLIPVL